MDTKWTPGPWRVMDLPTDGRDVSIEARIKSTGNPRFVGRVYGEGRVLKHQNEERDANARLIAAAPEMYEALMAVVSAFCAHAAPGSESMKQARAALAKARGES